MGYLLLAVVVTALLAYLLLYHFLLHEEEENKKKREEEEKKAREAAIQKLTDRIAQAKESQRRAMQEMMANDPDAAAKTLRRWIHQE